MLSAESTTRAWQLRDRVSDREKFFIDFTYDRQVTGNLEKAYQTLELWLQTYPRGDESTKPRVYWGAFPRMGPADSKERSRQPKEHIAADPDSRASGMPVLRPAISSWTVSTKPSAASTSRRTQAGESVSCVRYNIAVLKGDKDEMDRIVALAKGKRGAEHRVAHAEALALARSGRLQTGPAVFQPRHRSGPAREGEREAAASYQAARAVWEAVCGNAAEAKKNAMAALALSNGRDVEYAAALALALSGDSSRSQPLADDLEKRFPEDTFAKFTYVPVLRALSALSTGSRPTAWSGCKSLCPMSWR